MPSPTLVSRRGPGPFALAVVPAHRLRPLRDGRCPRRARTQSGEIELDILILATGYDALTGALLAFEVVRRNGRMLKDKWKGGPRSYLGTMLEGFPNLFAPSGPNGTLPQHLPT